MATLTLRTDRWKLGDLRPFEANSKEHPASQIAAIVASIRRFGFNDPIGVRSDGDIVEGHGRYLAALELGLREVPVLILPDDMTDADVDLYRIAHNKTTLSSTFDFRALAAELRHLSERDIQFADMGFDDAAVATLFSMFEEKDRTQRPQTKLMYEVVFETKDQKAKWAQFMRRVKDANPEVSPGKALTNIIEASGILDEKVRERVTRASLPAGAAS